jgi:hypothetical protein
MPGAASGMKWLGTIIPALPNEHPSRCRTFFSITVTFMPRRAQYSAVLRPMTPAPRMVTCLLMFART